jgi:hypothetical protein
MNTKTWAGRLGREIEAIKQNLLALGSMHPGSVSRQHQVCGNPACRCMHPEKPQKHGPYYLNFALAKPGACENHCWR